MRDRGGGRVGALVMRSCSAVLDAVWTEYPLVRGKGAQLLAIATVVGVSALALECALRGGSSERALALGAHP